MRYKLLLLFLLLSGILLGQNTYTVTKTGDYYPDSLLDAEDSALANGTFRWALSNALLDDGSTVEFNIVDSNAIGFYLIELVYPLPSISTTIIIDGTSQPEYSDSLKDPVIILDASNLNFVLGALLSIYSSGTIIKGLLLRNSVVSGIIINADSVSILNNVFNNIGSTELNAAIFISGTHNNILGNYIGVDVYERNAYPIVGRGIIIMKRNISEGYNVIGDATGLNRNVISNTSSYAIEIKNGINYNRIYDNRIYNTQGISLNTDDIDYCGNMCKPNPEIVSFVKQDTLLYVDGYSLAEDSVDLYVSYGDLSANKYYVSLKADSIGFWSYTGIADDLIIGLVCIATDSLGNSSGLSNYKSLIVESNIDTASPLITKILLGEEGTGILSGFHVPGREVYVYKEVDDLDDTTSLNLVKYELMGSALTLDSSKWVLGGLNITTDETFLALDGTNLRVEMNTVSSSADLKTIDQLTLTKISTNNLSMIRSISNKKVSVCPSTVDVNLVQDIDFPRPKLFSEANTSPNNVISLLGGSSLPSISEETNVTTNDGSINNSNTILNNTLPKLILNKPTVTNKEVSFVQTGYGFLQGAYYSWDFGDGTTSNSFYTTHSYSNEGEYKVFFTVQPNNGCAPISGYRLVDVSSLTQCSACKSTGLLNYGRKYIFSCWVKCVGLSGSQNVSTYSGVKVDVIFKIFINTTLTEVNRVSFTPVGNIIDGWQKLEGLFTVSNNASDIEIKLSNRSISSSTFYYFDDIRVHPYNSEVKTYSYDSRTLKPMAELDGDNYATIYEYDVDGNLIRVKKETSNGKFLIKETKSNFFRSSNE